MFGLIRFVGAGDAPGSIDDNLETFVVNLSTVIRRLLLVAGMSMALAAAQCVVVQPAPGGGGGVTPPPPPQQTLYANANYTKAARCNSRVGRNGGKGFYSVTGRACYSCPRGFRRAVTHGINSGRACVRGIASFRRAENLGPRGCTGNREFDFKGNCYRCPNGYRRVNANTVQCFRRT